MRVGVCACVIWVLEGVGVFCLGVFDCVCLMCLRVLCAMYCVRL